jgi:DNA-binding MarR family transcriptional regulator
MEAFSAIRRIMPLQHAYAFLFVALDEGRSVSQYAKYTGTTQPVMTRILFALSSRGRGRMPGCGLVRQVVDPQDGRSTQTFLTIRGKALVGEIVQAIRSDRQPAMKLRHQKSVRDLRRDQCLLQLADKARNLATGDIELLVRQAEVLIDHRQSKRQLIRRHRRAPTPSVRIN